MITEYFEEILNKKTVPEVSDNTGKYHMWDDGGVEAEVGEFLYGLVKVLQPNLILETGLYTGVSCSYLAQGLADNGTGRIVSIEHDAHFLEIAKKRLHDLNLAQWVEFNHISSLDYTSPYVFDLILLDTEPDIRFKELVRYFPRLKDGGYIFIHDLHRHLSQGDTPPQPPNWPFGKLPYEVVEWIEQDKLRVISFPTPRGLTAFYKPAPEDYKLV